MQKVLEISCSCLCDKYFGRLTVHIFKQYLCRCGFNLIHLRCSQKYFQLIYTLESSFIGAMTYIQFTCKENEHSFKKRKKHWNKKQLLDKYYFVIVFTLQSGSGSHLFMQNYESLPVCSELICKVLQEIYIWIPGGKVSPLGIYSSTAEPILRGGEGTEC